MRKLLGVALPSALVAVLITAACDVGTPVAPDLPANFAVAAGTPGCPTGFDMQGGGLPVDRNGDGFVCVKFVPNGPGTGFKEIQIDNNVAGGVGGCPTPGFTLRFTYELGFGEEADRNGDQQVCVNDDLTVVRDNTGP